MQSIEWRPIVGYEDLYRISSDGQVWSLRRNRAMAQTRNGDYLRVTLTNQGTKSLYLHRLIAAAFCGEPKAGEIARHLDGDPSNNMAPNISWGTYSDNAHDKTRHGRSSYNQNTNRTHCKNGHPLSGDNLGVLARGNRYCRQCRREYVRRRRSEGFAS